MAIQVKEAQGGKAMEILVSGKLAREDYQHFVPEFERLFNLHGKLRILFEMVDFHGWEAGALWDDLKFEMKHFSDIERVAMVGERRWEKGMSFFCRPFTTAKLRYFDRKHSEEAHQWIEAG